MIYAMCLSVGLFTTPQVCSAADSDPTYYHTGELAGSLKSDGPLAVYAPDAQHLWNRLFSILYIRPSNLPAERGGSPVRRFEGGDYIDFLSWGKTEYWSTPPISDRLHSLLDEFLSNNGASLINDPLKKSILLRDLWAAFDQFTEQNLNRFGSVETRRRRELTCRKLARVIESLRLTPEEIEALPDTYAAAIRSGRFENEQDFVRSNNYLPHELLTAPQDWVEVDFHQPGFHSDLYDRFITQHAREYHGRSYFRIFYRFPGGRDALVDYLKRLDANGVDWRQAAEDGFVLFKPDAPQVASGTELALVQFMMTLDSDLRPTPTPIVESVRHRTIRTLDGSDDLPTNTGVGMHILEYTMKRRLLFDDLRQGGLEREPDDLPLYRVIYQAKDSPDWGTQKRKVLFQQCADCHMTPSASRAGVHSIFSIAHQGGFQVGAQLGIVHPADPEQDETHADRVARWKLADVTYHRLLDMLDR